MKNQKTEFNYFTIPQWEKEQDYLRQPHINTIFYRFRHNLLSFIFAVWHSILQILEDIEKIVIYPVYY